MFPACPLSLCSFLTKLFWHILHSEHSTFEERKIWHLPEKILISTAVGSEAALYSAILIEACAKKPASWRLDPSHNEVIASGGLNPLHNCVIDKLFANISSSSLGLDICPRFKPVYLVSSLCPCALRMHLYSVFSCPWSARISVTTRCPSKSQSSIRRIDNDLSLLMATCQPGTWIKCSLPGQSLNCGPLTELKSFLRRFLNARILCSSLLKENFVSTTWPFQSLRMLSLKQNLPFVKGLLPFLCNSSWSDFRCELTLVMLVQYSPLGSYS